VQVKTSNKCGINQLLLTTASNTFFRFLPLKIGGDAMELEGSGIDASCGPTSSGGGGRCVGLEIVPMECDDIPLDLKLRTPFVLPLTFEETGAIKSDRRF
jgi:hypothetical protein